LQSKRLVGRVAELGSFGGIKVVMNLLSILAALLLVTGCQEKGPASVANPTDIAAEPPKVRECPNGHTTIKLVPITYGLIELTPDRRRAEESYEVAYGGCDVGSKGRFKIVCITCGAHTYEGSFPWYDKTTRVIIPAKQK
jgi:hypothetical protein